MTPELSFEVLTPVSVLDGENISSIEVEEAIAGHPSVLEVAVVVRGSSADGDGEDQNSSWVSSIAEIVGDVRGRELGTPGEQYDIPMAWSPAVGHHLVRAPGGLGFVQDVINTGYVGSAQPVDPLVDPDDARSWLAEALRLRGADLGPIEPIDIKDRDVELMRELRNALRAVVADPSIAVDRVVWRGPMLSTAIGADGTLIVEPLGDGYSWFAGLVAIDVFVSQQTGTWPRLKVCRNERCGVAFYDRSRNSSAVWHDAKACGNAHNLRVSRARRQSSST